MCGNELIPIELLIHPVSAYTADGHRFSLLTEGVLDHPSCKLLLINGMEDSIFPIEDNLIVGLKRNRRDLVLRG
jgi:hypothetical protein